MSKTIDVTTVMIVFIIILIIAIMSACMCNPETFEYTNWYVFLVTLAAFSIVLTFFFYYSLVEIQGQQQELNTIEETQKLTNSIVNITSVSMVQKMDTIPEFVKSLNPLDFNKNNKYNNKNINNIECDKKDITKHALSYEIFSVWQSVVSYKKFTSFKDEESNTILFLQWANSKELYEEWLKHRICFTDETVEYGDLLFSYGLNINRQTPSEYKKVIHKLTNSSTYRSIFD